jgi:hypothetical protein
VDESEHRTSALFFLANLQIVLGLIGFFGVFAYLAEPSSNSSRYQLLLLPSWAFLLAVPLLIWSAVIYRRGRSDLSTTGQWWIFIGCAMPVIAFATAFGVTLL